MKTVLKKPVAPAASKAAKAKPALKKSDATRLRVLEVTADLFRRNGYQATSMRDIATAVGMKSGSLYYYYASKEALLAAILNDNIDAHIATVKNAVTELPEGASVREKFRVAIVVAARIIAESGDMAAASAQTLSHLQEPEYSEQARHRQAYNQFWRDLINEGKKTGEIRKNVPDAVASMVVVGAMTFIAEWFDEERSTIEQIGETYASLLFDGLRA